MGLAAEVALKKPLECLVATGPDGEVHGFPVLSDGAATWSFCRKARLSSSREAKDEEHVCDVCLPAIASHLEIDSRDLKESLGGS